MPTTLYTRDSTPTFSPATNGTWNASGSALVREMQPAKGEARQQASVAHAAGNTTQVYRFVSKPLTAAHTISGTVDVVLHGTVDFGDTAQLRCHVWVTQGDTNAARGVLLANAQAALGPVTIDGTSGTLGWGATGEPISSVSAQAGDRIVWELGAGGGSTTTLLFYRAGTGADQTIGGSDVDRVGFLRFNTPTMDFAERVPNVRAWICE